MLPNKARPRVPYTFGPLYDLLLERFPEHRSQQKVFDVPRLARDMGLAHETIYRCVRNDELKISVAHKLLELSRNLFPENPLFWDDLLPFVLPDYEALRDPTKALLA